MELLKMGSKDQCLIYAAAMVLDIAPLTIIESIGHDGEEIVSPSCPPPFNKAGVHIQEIMDVCYSHGYLLAMIEVDPYIGSQYSCPRKIFDDKKCRDRLYKYLMGNKAILATTNHALAWDGYYVFDPVGQIRGIDDVIPLIREIFILVRLRK